MKILVVSQYFWPENFRINELVTEWVKRGHEVTVLTGMPNYPDGEVFDEYKIAPHSYASYAGAHIVRVPMVPRRKGKFWLALNYISFAASASLIGAWKLRRQETEVIFVFEPSPVTVGIPSAILRYMKRAPQIFWVLDLWPETLRAVGVLRASWQLKIVEKLVRWIYRRCDLILAQSKSFVANIRHYSGAAQWIEYFPAWAEAAFDQHAVIPAPEVPEQQHVFTVMFAGNIGESQDFPAILEAVETLKERDDIRWIVIGDGRAAEWVSQQIEMRGLEKRITLAGRYPLERMPSFFAHADALLVSLTDQPIFAMTIPGKLQSYFAAGIPVLGMLNGEGGEVITEAGAGLVCRAGDGKALAELVEKMIDLDLADRQEMGKNGKQFCKEKFNRGHQIDQLENWMESLISRKKSQGG